MKKWLISLGIILTATTAQAENWICYDSVDKNITIRRQGDCLSLGICSGPNNEGLPSNCFEATQEEYDKAREQFVKVDVNSIPRVVDMSQAEIDAINSGNLNLETLALRNAAKNTLDQRVDSGVILRAFADVMMREINILRNQHGLPARTLGQLKTAIKDRIDSGDVDN